MKKSFDFGAGELDIGLTAPFKFTDPRTKNEIYIDGCRVKQLHTPDLTKIRTRVAKSEEGTNLLEDGDVILSVGLLWFTSKGSRVDRNLNNILIQRMSVDDVVKATLFISMLTRGSSYISTAYICQNKKCRKETLFDLNPDEEIPEEILKNEPERAIMEDFMDFYGESVHPNRDKPFTVELKHPIRLSNGSKDGKQVFIEATKYTFKWPCYGDYTDAASDSRKEDAIDDWVLFENLIGINDFSEKETELLKDENGFDVVMATNLEDGRRIADKLNEYGMKVDHYYDCIHCGKRQEVGFDYTNFLGFLRS